MKTKPLHTFNTSALTKQDEPLELLIFYFNQLINKNTPIKTTLTLASLPKKIVHFLNEGLISQKEGFGARGVCYDWYEVTV